MTREYRLIAAAALMLLMHSVTAGVARAASFELKAGDRVAFIGATFIEREARFGHIEAALTSRWPERHITFRNFGWSGDNVLGESRAYFGPVSDGFKHLIDNLKLFEPNVLVVCYGNNEAWAGPAGVTEFVKQYEALLDALTVTAEGKQDRPRLLLLSPLPLEKLPQPLPDPTTHNQHVALYRDAVRGIAERRGAAFLDLFDALHAAMAKPESHLTENGVHFGDEGYRLAARLIADAIAGPARGVKTYEAGSVKVTTDHAAELAGHSSGAEVLRFTRTPLNVTEQPYRLSVTGLTPGRYVLRIDGQDVLKADAAALAAGVTLADGPEVFQARLLREAIVQKNELFFHGYRPANETYLRGFRKREQGNNAVEIPMFWPLVEKKEQAIATLRTPTSHTYELVKTAGESK